MVNTVAVRPGFPMLLAAAARTAGTFVAGLPGNPQSAIVALVVAGRAAAGRPDRPARAGAAAGRRWPSRSRAGATTPIWPWSGWTRRRAAHPVPHVGSAMLRGLAGADGFAVIAPGTAGEAGRPVPLVPLPLLPGSGP